MRNFAGQVIVVAKWAYQTRQVYQSSFTYKVQSFMIIFWNASFCVAKTVLNVYIGQQQPILKKVNSWICHLGCQPDLIKISYKNLICMLWILKYLQKHKNDGRPALWVPIIIIESQIYVSMSRFQSKNYKSYKTTNIFHMVGNNWMKA